MLSTQHSIHLHPSLLSLSVFIVSDSEEVEGESDEEEPWVVERDDDHGIENVPPTQAYTLPSTPLITPSCSTPYTPYTAVAFWGGDDSPTVGGTGTSGQLPKHRPLTERNHTCTTPGWLRLKGAQIIRLPWGG